MDKLKQTVKSSILLKKEQMKKYDENTKPKQPET